LRRRRRLRWMLGYASPIVISAQSRQIWRRARARIKPGAPSGPWPSRRRALAAARLRPGRRLWRAALSRAAIRVPFSALAAKSSSLRSRCTPHSVTHRRCRKSNPPARRPAYPNSTEKKEGSGLRRGRPRLRRGLYRGSQKHTVSVPRVRPAFRRGFDYASSPTMVGPRNARPKITVCLPCVCAQCCPGDSIRGTAGRGAPAPSRGREHRPNSPSPLDAEGGAVAIAHGRPLRR